MTNFFADAWDRLAPTFGDNLGGVEVQISRPFALKDVAALRAVGALVLSAPVTAGATILHLALASGGRISGTLPAGTLLTLAAVAYRVAADAVASGSSLTVTVSPAVVADVAAAAPVSVAPPLVTVDGCIVSQVKAFDVSAKLSVDLAAKVAIPVANCPPGFAPRLDDFLTIVSGAAGLPAGFGGRIAVAPPTTGGWHDVWIGYNPTGGSNP